MRCNLTRLFSFAILCLNPLKAFLNRKLAALITVIKAAQKLKRSNHVKLKNNLNSFAYNEAVEFLYSIENTAFY